MALLRLSAPIAIVGTALLLGACAKRSQDKSEPAASAGQAPEEEPSDESVAAPPPAQAPAAPMPAPGANTAGPSSLTDDKEGAKKAKDFATLEDAQAAFTQAQTELSALLTPGGKAQPLAGGDGRCGKACKAFSSLKRAASAICRIAGSDDGRCTKAQKSVDENEKRVAPCGCEDE